MDNNIKFDARKAMGNLSERILFGQFLINKGFTSYSILNEAIKLQESECSNMKLGEILHSRFDVFESEEELTSVVREFFSMRRGILDERKHENEKVSVNTIIEDVDYFLNQYAQTLDIKTLQKAILILEGEMEYRRGRQIES
jgi:hypothetical protein